MSIFPTELPSGYRWANEVECEAASATGDFNTMIQVQRGGTDNEPETDLAVLDVERLYLHGYNIFTEWSQCEVCDLPVNEHEWVDLDHNGIVVKCSGVNPK